MYWYLYVYGDCARYVVYCTVILIRAITHVAIRLTPKSLWGHFHRREGYITLPRYFEKKILCRHKIVNPPEGLKTLSRETFQNNPSRVFFYLHSSGTQLCRKLWRETVIHPIRGLGFFLLQRYFRNHSHPGVFSKMSLLKRFAKVPPEDFSQNQRPRG